ncbi:MAG TPA: efflux RND transporter periplasmic adaptor subunit, partial [bacterium]|nr:efflux RND transporter periplasmic adaptor subunit [bacterium]
MNRRILLIIAVGLVGFAVGIVAQSSRHAPDAAHEAGEAKQLWTCSMHPQVIQDRPGMCPICHMALTPLRTGGGPASQDSSAAGAGSVTIDPAMMQNMGLRTAQVRSGSVARTVHAVGVLEEAQPMQRDITMRVSGWITKLAAHTEGMHVHQGDALFEITSPEIQVAVDELHATTGSPEMHDLAKKKLSFYGLDESEIARLEKLDDTPDAVVFRSPISGEVVEKAVVSGASVKPGDRVLRIVDHETLWVDAQVFEKDMPLVRVGRSARAEVSGLPGKTFEGKVVFIHPHVDPMSRATMVRLEIPNPERSLRPGMYANVEIEGDRDAHAVLAPREAIIDSGTRQIVFVAQGDGRFDPRPVRMGLEGEEGWVEVEGLAVGETVVTSGQFLLDSESRLREAIDKYREGGRPGHNHVQTARADTSLIQDVDQLHEEYLRMARRFGEMESSNQPVDAGPLREAAAQLEMHLPDQEKPLANAIADAAGDLSGKSLEGQRDRFKKVSEAMIQLARVRPPSTRISEKLYVMHCPMAPGNWLQTSETLANPYYGRTMKQCGEVIATIAALP